MKKINLSDICSFLFGLIFILAIGFFWFDPKIIFRIICSDILLLVSLTWFEYYYVKN